MKYLIVNLPDYTIASPPDENSLGAVLDEVLIEHFLDRKVVIRGVASSEHPGLSVDELINVAKTTGWDRYDQSRTGDRYENVENERIDLFGFTATVSKSMRLFHQMIYGFYYSAISIHGRPVRIDMVLVYDAEQMQQIPHAYQDRDDIKDDGYIFKNLHDKTSALIGIIKIS